MTFRVPAQGNLALREGSGHGLSKVCMTAIYGSSAAVLCVGLWLLKWLGGGGHQRRQWHKRRRAIVGQMRGAGRVEAAPARYILAALCSWHVQYMHVWFLAVRNSYFQQMLNVHCSASPLRAECQIERIAEAGL